MEEKDWILVSEKHKSYIVHDFYRNVKMISEGGKFHSKSCAYKTRDELIEKCKILPEPCIECGSVVQSNYLEPSGSEIKKYNICFSCNHWRQKVERYSNKDQVVIDGDCYYIKPNKDPDCGFSGFGGQLFHIKKDNGEIIHTNNMWHNGEIPSHFRDRLKDNAKFIQQ
jgi:hypothetical protein